MRLIKAMARVLGFQKRSSVITAVSGEGGDSLLLFDSGGITLMHLGLI